MRPKSKIQKGRRFENLINKEIEAGGLGRATRTPGSGSGKLKGDSFNNLDFLIEAKNQKTIKIQEWVRQAKQQAKIGNYDPQKWALVFRDPGSPEVNPEIYVTIDFYQWLELLKKESEPRIKEPDRNLKWDLKRLIADAKKVIKQIE